LANSSIRASVWLVKETDITKLGSHGVAEVHQVAFRQLDDAVLVGEFDLVDLRLDVGPFQVAAKSPRV
jgi:hypothetical protein